MYTARIQHPHNAHEELDVSVEDLVARSRHPKVVALGEAGLDYHYDLSPRDAQETGFRRHIAAARQTGLPLVIHSREAIRLARILTEETGQGAFSAVLHCFTAGPELAQPNRMGLHIPFTGILTFKRSDELRAIAAALPVGSHPGRDRLALSRPGQIPRQAQRARLCGRGRECAGSDAGRLHRRDCVPDDGKFLPPVQQGAAELGRGGMTFSVTILGCGFSGGVPRPGLGWGHCDPANPKNRRRRCSILVERAAADGRRTRVLVDTSPDLREQLLDAGVDWLDGVLYTHEHADHTHGIDDLRGLFIGNRRRVDIYADEPTWRVLALRFGYCFVTPPGSNYPPIANHHSIGPGKPVTVAGPGGTVTATPLLQDHGDIASLGFRFGSMAYSSDLIDLPPESVALLEGIDLWIVDALWDRPHPSHFHLDLTLEWIERIKPRRAILTNMHSDLDFEELRAKPPPHVEPGYDGLRTAFGGSAGGPVVRWSADEVPRFRGF